MSVLQICVVKKKLGVDGKDIMHRGFIANIKQCDRSSSIRKAKGTTRITLDLACKGRAFIRFEGIGLHPAKDVEPTVCKVVKSRYICYRIKFSYVSEVSVSTHQSSGQRDYCTVLESLGKGGSGKVYLLQFHNGLKYALKTMYLEKKYMKEAEAVAEAEAEGRTMMKLEHPHLVQCCDMSRVGSYFCLLLEFCSGKSLKQEIAKHVIEESRAIEWFAQMSDAIQYLHSKHLMHRDIKPENILLDEYNFIKISDFGISKVLEETAQNAKTYIGTKDYMSPQILNNEPYTNKTDIWSLGCVFYEVLAGKLPFTKKQLNDINNIPNPRLPDSVNQHLRSLIHKMLERDEPTRHSARRVFAFITEKLLSGKYVRAQYKPLEKVELDVESVAKAIADYNRINDNLSN